MASFSDSRIFLYGPPGSGKTSLGKVLANALDVEFVDLDNEIAAHAGMSIPAIFAANGESGFREIESRALHEAIRAPRRVIALGGGALLDPQNRRLAEESGRVLCLQADLDTLVRRLEGEADRRPLLGASPSWRERLDALLAQRTAHYAAFNLQLDTNRMPVDQLAWEAQVLTGSFRISGMGTGYDVRIRPGCLNHLGEMLSSRGLMGPLALILDTNTARHYQNEAENSLRAAGYVVHPIVIQAGEEYKNLTTISHLWDGFFRAGLERGSTVVAVGGGVTGDLAGFAAATYLRGLRWVAVPTTLLAMIDASLGGKTGFDLPQGKNLVGAFHPPSLVAADPRTLRTLPEGELRSGMAEVVKHGILGDASLFERCAGGWEQVRGPEDEPDWDETVRRAIAVKARVIQADPFEKNVRATLNLGHTLGHAIEAASGYRLRHGEAVAIGMVAISRIAAEMGACSWETAERITGVLSGLGLPVEIPAGLNRQVFHTALYADKKRAGGKIRFVIPREIGKVDYGVVIERDFTALLPESK